MNPLLPDESVTQNVFRLMLITNMTRYNHLSDIQIASYDKHIFTGVHNVSSLPEM